MKNQSTVLIMALIFCLTLIGCNHNDKKPTETGGNTVVTDTDTRGKIELGNGSEMNIGSSKSGKNMELPAEFPVDVIPILYDAKIDNIIKNDSNKAININFSTGKSLDEAAVFYKQVMKDGSDTNEIRGDDSYIIMGVKNDYVATITIVVPRGDTIVNIDVRPQAK